MSCIFSHTWIYSNKVIYSNNVNDYEETKYSIKTCNCGAKMELISITQLAEGELEEWKRIA